MALSPEGELLRTAADPVSVRTALLVPSLVKDNGVASEDSSVARVCVCAVTKSMASEAGGRERVIGVEARACAPMVSVT